MRMISAQNTAAQSGLVPGWFARALAASSLLSDGLLERAVQHQPRFSSAAGVERVNLSQPAPPGSLTRYNSTCANYDSSTTRSSVAEDTRGLGAGAWLDSFAGDPCCPARSRSELCNTEETGRDWLGEVRLGYFGSGFEQETPEGLRAVKPVLPDSGVVILRMPLGIGRRQFIETYSQRAEPDSENPWQTRMSPCPFLKDNRCSVYEDRPAECSGYPYLYQPAFVFRTIGMIERTFTCPIVYQVHGRTEEISGFSWHSLTASHREPETQI
jgi:Putative zinc- or iron-chelating domain